MSYYQLVSWDSPPSYDELVTGSLPEMKFDNPPPHGVYLPVPDHLSPTILPVTVVHQTNVLVGTSGGIIICPQCNARNQVGVERYATGKTYCVALMLRCFHCRPCVCALCCCNCCNKASQFFPICNACLGSF